MARKSNAEIIKEQKNTIKQLFGAYTILLCAAAIFIFSLHNLFINYKGAKLCMMYLLAPIIFFISNVINKEIGYKNAMMSVGISTFVLFFYGLCTNFIIYNSFNLFSCLGFTMAYLFSQSVSLAIYNYLLVNTRLPIACVIINYIFDLSLQTTHISSQVLVDFQRIRHNSTKLILFFKIYVIFRCVNY